MLVDDVLVRLCELQDIDIQIRTHEVAIASVDNGDQLKLIAASQQQRHRQARERAKHAREESRATEGARAALANRLEELKSQLRAEGVDEQVCGLLRREGESCRRLARVKDTMRANCERVNSLRRTRDVLRLDFLAAIAGRRRALEVVEGLKGRGASSDVIAHAETRAAKCDAQWLLLAERWNSKELALREAETALKSAEEAVANERCQHGDIVDSLCRLIGNDLNVVRDSWRQRNKTEGALKSVERDLRRCRCVADEAEAAEEATLAIAVAAETQWRNAMAQHQASTASLREEVASLQRCRDAHAARIDASLLGTYGAICRNHDGLGIAERRGGYCGSCNVRLVAEPLIRLSSGQVVERCANCKRILISPRHAAQGCTDGARVEHLLHWTVLPPGELQSIIRRRSTGALAGDDAHDCTNRLAFLRGLGPAREWRGVPLGGTPEYYAFEFPRYVIADCPAYGNALYYCSISQNWQYVLGLEKQEALNRGAKRIVHKLFWRDKARKLAG